MSNPKVIIIGGPNGAGKSTSAPKLLRGPLRVDHFVNADVIARGLSEFNPESVALEAGRVMLRRLDELATRRISFAFETTLASRTFAPLSETYVQTDTSFICSTFGCRPLNCPSHAWPRGSRWADTTYPTKR